jgi:hypothetical protein
MTVPHEIDAAAANSMAVEPSSKKPTPIDSQGVKPGKSAVTPMMHERVLL